MRRILCCSIAIIAILTAPAEAQHQYSLLDRIFEAGVVAICRMENAVKPNNLLEAGKVDLVIEDVIRSHAAIKGRKFVVLPYYREPTKAKLLVAMDAYKGGIHPYWAAHVDAEGDMERFVRGALKLKDKSPLGRARYAVDFLLSPSEDVAHSAFIEVKRVSLADIRKIAEALKPEPWVKALEDRKSAPEQVAMYALILAHCGKMEHAALVRKLIDDKKLMESFGFEIYFAYVLLDRDNGWQTVAGVLEQGAGPFLKRNAALQAARLMYEQRKDLVAEKKSLRAVVAVLDIPDMADFAIEDLRRWKRWEYCDSILKLPTMPGFEKRFLVRQNALRFALQCPKQQAKDYVKAERTRDREFVEDTEELLALEYPPN